MLSRLKIFENGDFEWKDARDKIQMQTVDCDGMLEDVTIDEVVEWGMEMLFSDLYEMRRIEMLQLSAVRSDHNTVSEPTRINHYSDQPHILFIDSHNYSGAFKRQARNRQTLFGCWRDSGYSKDFIVQDDKLRKTTGNEIYDDLTNAATYINGSNRVHFKVTVSTLPVQKSQKFIQFRVQFHSEQ